MLLVRSFLLTVLFFTAMIFSEEDRFQSINIRYMGATQEDLPAVKELMAIVWRDTYTQFYSQEVVERAIAELQTLEYLNGQLINQNIYFLIAKNLDGQVVGVITTEKLNSEEAKVMRLYIHPEYQHQKIGSSLLRATERYFSDVKFITLDVKEKNTPAIAFYKKHGYLPTHKKDHVIFNESAVNILFCKQLR